MGHYFDDEDYKPIEGYSFRDDGKLFYKAEMVPYGMFANSKFPHPGEIYKTKEEAKQAAIKYLNSRIDSKKEELLVLKNFLKKVKSNE